MVCVSGGPAVHDYLLIAAISLTLPSLAAIALIGYAFVRTGDLRALDHLRTVFRPWPSVGGRRADHADDGDDDDDIGQDGSRGHRGS
jgi:hypothetical protein